MLKALIGATGSPGRPLASFFKRMTWRKTLEALLR